MKGQDIPGIPGLSWSAFGGQRSPAAWGGAAAQLQTPQSTVREAMVADEAQVPFLPLRGHCNGLAPPGWQNQAHQSTLYMAY